MITNLVSLYFRYRPRNHTRVTLRVLIIAVIVASPSLFEIIVVWLFIEDFSVPDIFDGPRFALNITTIGLLYHFLSNVADKYLSKFHPFSSTKDEENRKSFNAFKNMFGYQNMKRNLEDAEYGIDLDFATSLWAAEAFLDPKFIIYDKELENSRIDLINEIISYNYFLSIHLYPDYSNSNRFVIPPEWKHTGMLSKYLDHEKKIRERSTVLIDKLDDFYKKARLNGLLSTDS
ncbi:MAG: hypothetical protein LAT81_13785 [Oceanicaulis sp.]|nr:hypothetical protein [Oceanicaulis sp.]